VINIENLTAKK